jgi:hypothetical protein
LELRESWWRPGDCIAVRLKVRLPEGLKDFWDNDYFWILCCYIAVRFATMHVLFSSRNIVGASDPRTNPCAASLNDARPSVVLAVCGPDVPVLPCRLWWLRRAMGSRIQASENYSFKCVTLKG